MSHWTPLGPPRQTQNNPPPAPNPANQPHPQVPTFAGLGIQQANPNPFGFAPPNLNPAPQPPVNPFASLNTYPNANTQGGFHGFGAPSNSQAPHQPSQPATASNNPTANDDEDEYEDSDDEDPDNIDPDLEYDETSPIALTLRVPLNVKGNNNIVAIDAGKLAKQVADAMVTSLRDLSCGNNGIPMIDHNGQPRPVNVRVDLKVTVTGDKNTIGEKAVLALVPAAARNAMMESILPATPLTPLEDKVFTGVIDQLRATGVNLNPTDKSTPPNLPEVKKRDGGGSWSDGQGGSSDAGPASSPKRSRFH